MNANNIVKAQNNQLSTKINKIDCYCKFSKIYFFKLCMKETVVAAAFMFELNILQIFEPRNDILFALFLFCNVVYPMSSVI